MWVSQYPEAVDDVDCGPLANEARTSASRSDGTGRHGLDGEVANPSSAALPGTRRHQSSRRMSVSNPSAPTGACGFESHPGHANSPVAVRLLSSSPLLVAPTNAMTHESRAAPSGREANVPRCGWALQWSVHPVSGPPSGKSNEIALRIPEEGHLLGLAGRSNWPAPSTWITCGSDTTVDSGRAEVLCGRPRHRPLRGRAGTMVLPIPAASECLRCRRIRGPAGRSGR